MKRILTTIQKEASKILLLTVLAGAMASCDSVLDYDDGDCSIKYSVKFKYDYNILNVDAFSQQVRTVTLYAFDDNGKLVTQQTAEGEELGEETFAMNVDFEPDKYHLIAWAGRNDESFAVPLLEQNQSKLEELTVKMLRTSVDNTRASSEEGKNIVDKSLHPLWHGEVTKGPVTRNGREKSVTVSLTKNTNTIRIVVAQVVKEDEPVTRAIKKDIIKCSIYDDNGYMNYDNSLLEDDLLTYIPYHTSDETVKTRAFSTGEQEEEEYKAVAAEISVGRLMADKNPKLTITDDEANITLFSTSTLTKYLEMLRTSQYPQYGSQEYLDREDQYEMIFFVDTNLTLMKSFILINGWKVKINEIDF